MELEKLINILTEASIAYYNGSPIMDDHEYDKYENDYYCTTGKRFRIIEPVKGEKFLHEWNGKSYRALSLDKTKDVNLIHSKFKSFSKKGKSNDAVVMWKLDGSTIQLYYAYDNKLKKLKLEKAVTRGTDGIEGEVITHNAVHINGIPYTIDSQDAFLIVRGKAIMSYSEFNRICNSESEGDYANPRNLATATIGMDNPEEGVMKRKIDFKAFNMVDRRGFNDEDYRGEWFGTRLEQLKCLGFDVVDYVVTPIDNLKSIMADFEKRATDYDYPVDGEVIAYDDVLWAESQPGTEHNPHISCGYALKWADETKETTLRYIEWNTTRTGLINPVAVFDEIELEGTTVSRATLHNVSFILNKDICAGDKISVYKANKIIPKIDLSLSAESRGDDYYKKYSKE